jgi:hypothetical protein
MKKNCILFSFHKLLSSAATLENDVMIINRISYFEKPLICQTRVSPRGACASAKIALEAAGAE